MSARDRHRPWFWRSHAVRVLPAPRVLRDPSDDYPIDAMLRWFATSSAMRRLLEWASGDRAAGRLKPPTREVPEK